MKMLVLNCGCFVFLWTSVQERDQTSLNIKLGILNYSPWYLQMRDIRVRICR